MVQYNHTKLVLFIWLGGDTSLTGAKIDQILLILATQIITVLSYNKPGEKHHWIANTANIKLSLLLNEAIWKFWDFERRNFG